MLTKELSDQQLENWIFNSDPADVRKEYDQSAGVQREMMKSIIDGYISLGDSPLGHEFPELSWLKDNLHDTRI